MKILFLFGLMLALTCLAAAVSCKKEKAPSDKGILTATVPSTQIPPASSSASAKFSLLSIQTIDGLNRQFRFNLQKIDPYTAQFSVDDSATFLLHWNNNCSKNTKNFVYPILYF